MKKDLAVNVICSLLILLFTYTGVSKLLTQPLFKATLSQMPFIAPGAAFLAWLVPLSELVLALLLLFYPTKRIGLYGSLALLCGLTLYILWLLLTASKLPCRCGGIISQLGWKQHFLFNAALMAATIYAIHLHGQSTRSNRIKTTHA